MKNYLFIFLLTMAFGIMCGCAGDGDVNARFDTKEEILARIKPPVIPQRSFLITDFGGVGDGVTNSKPAFDKAMAASEEAGGGRIVVPAGDYFMEGPIHFVSNTDLHLAEGARLFFSSEPAHYLPVVPTSWEGTLLYNYSPFIYAYQCENIAITGSGVIDGEASDTWQLWREIQRESQLLSRQMNNDQVPVAQRIFGDGHYLRPHLIQFYDCRNILVEDVKIEDSPFWCLHLLMCQNVTVRGIRFDAQNKNNDGIDPEYSEDVLIENVVFNNADDNVAIKAGRDLEGRTIGRSTKNIIVRNCKLLGLHGIVIGSEMAAGVHNVFVENCEAIGYLKRGLYIKSNPDRGGEISNIFFRNVKLDKVEDAFFITSFYHQEGKGHVTHIHNIFVEDVYCREATAAGIVIHGFPEKKVHNIHFTNVTIEQAQIAFDLQEARNIILEDVSIGGQAGPPSWVQ
ncbi:glycoside hydrolase family 28 protein [Alkaliflexus imshenetskii]|uniref:glycoside hydrolase family 28 protein n=1 Tax=Alkaliflexus imshenetskii TaxID=286730 RepID=UPI0004B99ABA|nr:glycoside hydrolase family 28 protein [Alkaliflexus imshenetskii]